MEEVNEIICHAAMKAREETSDEPEPALVGPVDWPVQVTLNRGLEGAIACETQIGYVNGAKGWLLYRGYDCFELSEKSSFEETAFLLLFGKLPTRQEFDEFVAKLHNYRSVPDPVLNVLGQLPTAKTHPMAALRTATSILGMLDDSAEETTVPAETEVSIKLIAQIATLAAAIGRLRQGQDPVPPRPDFSHAGNFLYMLTGSEPGPLATRIMDVALILHADHGMNASTFSTMVINSSLSDVYSSVVGGIGSLKGPLHGGANERVLYDLLEIGSPDKVVEWYRNARATKRKIMGFGHRVYRAYDPRARILGPLAQMLAQKNPEISNLYETAAELERVVVKDLGKKKKIFPNVDFYSGIVYRALGIETPMFTPIFALSRIAGWTARTLEYLADNRIFRPRAVYTGPLRLDYLPIDQRS